MNDPQLARAIERANSGAFGTVLLPFALIANAIIITIFGNSLGKRIFGLKAYSIRPDQPPSLWFNIARELRVWCFGYALGIPIVNLFTMAANFSAIKAGEPARYDVGRARVAQRPISKVRRVIAGFLVAAFAIGLTLTDRLLEMAERQQTVRSAQGSPRSSPIAPAARLNWKNPITGQMVGLPVGWSQKPIADQPGQQLSLLESPDGNLAVLLASEDGGSVLTLPAYSLRLSEAQRDAWTNVTVWQEAFFADRAIRYRSMQATEEKTRAGLILWKQGSRFWRVLVIDARAQQAIDPRDYPLVRTLMRSVPTS